MSAFDDEFGLFSDDEAAAGDEERKPTLGARRIASSETIIDDIEPEEERQPRRRGVGGDRPRGGGGGGGGGRRDQDRGPRSAGDPAVAQARAATLLEYLARKLVSKPDEVIVEVVEGSRGPVIELEVHPEDFGKVIGRGGRVAQALRTLVRATAEGKVSVDIVDVEDDDEHESDVEHAGSPASEDEPVVDAIASEEPEEVAEAGSAAPAAPKKRTAAKGGAKKRGGSAAKGSRKR